MTQTLSSTLRNLLSDVRAVTDPLRGVDLEEGAYVSGHVPHIAPQAYLVRHPKGLDDEGLALAETEATRPMPSVYQEFLREMNGGRILNIDFYGLTGGMLLRDPTDPVGQPFSIAFDNEWYRRADNIPEGHFGFAAANGPLRTQGHFFLTSIGTVEMYHRDEDRIGKSWPSFSDFLLDEITRRLAALDERGKFQDTFQLLPGDTSDWEARAEEKYLDSLSPFARMKRKIWRPR